MCNSISESCPAAEVLAGAPCPHSGRWRSHMGPCLVQKSSPGSWPVRAVLRGVTGVWVSPSSVQPRGRQVPCLLHSPPCTSGQASYWGDAHTQPNHPPKFRKLTKGHTVKLCSPVCLAEPLQGAGASTYHPARPACSLLYSTTPSHAHTLPVPHQVQDHCTPSSLLTPSLPACPDDLGPPAYPGGGSRRGSQ